MNGDILDYISTFLLCEKIQKTRKFLMWTIFLLFPRKTKEFIGNFHFFFDKMSFYKFYLKLIYFCLLGISCGFSWQTLLRLKFPLNSTKKIWKIILIGNSPFIFSQITLNFLDIFPELFQIKITFVIENVPLENCTISMDCFHELSNDNFLHLFL